MKISNIIIISFIPLSKNLISNYFTPRRLIYSFIKYHLNRINNVFIKANNVERLKFFSILINRIFHMFCKIIFCNKRQLPTHYSSAPSNASYIILATSYPRFTGTAFPTCLYCDITFPQNSQLSGKL